MRVGRRRALGIFEIMTVGSTAAYVGLRQALHAQPACVPQSFPTQIDRIDFRPVPRSQRTGGAA